MPTVRTILETPRLETRSLTPGVGEDRVVAWAHVCELPDPWSWIGDDALVMTTGLAVPQAPAAQRAYIEGMHGAGIAAVTIGERMSSPPLSAEMLERAAELGFPILETAHDTPFIALAMAVADAQHQERQERLRLTERLYATLREHVGVSDFDGLLADLSEVLGGALRMDPGGPEPDQAPARDRIVAHSDGEYTLPLMPTGSGRLKLSLPQEASPDYSVLQHASAIVSGVFATHVAARRQRQLQGSLLLGNIFDGTISPRTAVELVAGYGVVPPFALAACEAVVGSDGIDRTDRRLEAEGIAGLLTEKDGYLYLLGTGSPALENALEELAPSDGPTALSSPFDGLDRLDEARRRTRLLVSEAKLSGETFIRQSDHERGPAVLPSESDARRELVQQTLGVLIDYDETGRSDLLRTLHVFLAANRSWVRASERLFLHRQTLVSRIARVEELTGYRVGSMHGSATLWFALQAAVAEGIIDPVGESVEDR